MLLGKRKDYYTILFVCSGNSCRSPMAEYALRDLMPDDTDWQVCSAGVLAGRGMPASNAGIAVMDELAYLEFGMFVDHERDRAS